MTKNAVQKQQVCSPTAGPEDGCSSKYTSVELVLEILLKPKINTSHLASKNLESRDRGHTKVLIVMCIFKAIDSSLVRPGRGTNSHSVAVACPLKSKQYYPCSLLQGAVISIEIRTCLISR